MTTTYSASVALSYDPAEVWSIIVDDSKQRSISKVCFPHVIGTGSLNVSMHRVAQAATRFLWTDGKGKPDGDDVNAYHLEVLCGAKVAFDFDLPNGIIEPRKKGAVYSGEVKKVAGERIAYGMALCFMKKYWPRFRMTGVLHIPEGKKGTGKRPDFILPISGPKGGTLALEARSRGYSATLTPRELADLDGKKKNKKLYEAVLGVYFHYGGWLGHTSSVTGRKTATRLLVADPNGDDDPDKREVNEVVEALDRYIDITHVIGLHSYEARLRKALDSYVRNAPLPVALTQPFPEGRTPIHPQRRRYGKGLLYIGRVFSTLLSDVAKGEKTLEKALELGDLGLYSFIGVHKTILRAIHNGEWYSLINIEINADESVDQRKRRGNIIFDNEGTVVESEVVVPGTQQADEIIASLRHDDISDEER